MFVGLGFFRVFSGGVVVELFVFCVCFCFVCFIWGFFGGLFLSVGFMVV